MGLCCDKHSYTQKLPKPTIVTPDYLYVPNRLNEPLPNLSEGVSGIKNLGNTCYINSTIQCLLNTQPLLDYFLSGVNEEHQKTYSEYSEAFANLCERKWLNEIGIIKPDDLVYLIWDSGYFRPRVQQDAHELLYFLLNRIHEDLNNPKKKKHIKLETALDSLEMKAARTWKHHLLLNRSIIVDLFQGQLKSTLECLECGHSKTRFEQFLCLSLPIPNQTQISLEDCFSEFTKNELLSLDNKWECKYCNKKVFALKKYDLWKVPPVFIIQFKRFQEVEGKRCKLSDCIEYATEDMDLSPFVVGPQKESPVYDLYGIINHRGSLTQGHYTASVRNMTSHEWQGFDDSLVISDNEFKFSKHAYILFYEKTSVKQFSHQKIDLPELWPHLLTIERMKSDWSDEESVCGSPTNIKRRRILEGEFKGIQWVEEIRADPITELSKGNFKIYFLAERIPKEIRASDEDDLKRRRIRKWPLFIKGSLSIRKKDIVAVRKGNLVCCQVTLRQYRMESRYRMVNLESREEARIYRKEVTLSISRS